MLSEHPSPHAQFRTTHWSVILTAQDPATPAASAALARLRCPDRLWRTLENLALQLGPLAWSLPIGITALTAQRRRSEASVCTVGKQDDNSKSARWYGEPTVEPVRNRPDSSPCFVPQRRTSAASFAADLSLLQYFGNQRSSGSIGVGTGRPHRGREIPSRNRSAGLPPGAVVAPCQPAAVPEAGAQTGSLPAPAVAEVTEQTRLNPAFEIGPGGQLGQIGAPTAESLGIGGSGLLATTATVAPRVHFAKRTHFPSAVQGFLHPHLAKRTLARSAPRSSPVKPGQTQSNRSPVKQAISRTLRPRLARTSSPRSPWFSVTGNLLSLPTSPERRTPTRRVWPASTSGFAPNWTSALLRRGRDARSLHRGVLLTSAPWPVLK